MAKSKTLSTTTTLEAATRAKRTPGTKPAPKRRARVTPPPSLLGHDAIAQRAYELFVQDGAQHGRDREHWLRAEQELRGQPEQQAS